MRPRSAGGPSLDDADVEVAVLHRAREVAVLERRAHRRVLARRHAAAEHQRLGAAADAGPQRADEHVVALRLGHGDGPDLPAPGRAQPEGVRIGFVLPSTPQTPRDADPSRRVAARRTSLEDDALPVTDTALSTPHRWLPFGDRSRARRLVKVLAWLVGIGLVLAVLDLLGLDIRGWFSDLWDALERDRARVPARGLDAPDRADDADRVRLVLDPARRVPGRAASRTCRSSPPTPPGSR